MIGALLPESDYRKENIIVKPIHSSEYPKVGKQNFGE